MKKMSRSGANVSVAGLDGLMRQANVLSGYQSGARSFGQLRKTSEGTDIQLCGAHTCSASITPSIRSGLQCQMPDRMSVVESMELRQRLSLNLGPGLTLLPCQASPRALSLN